MDVIFGPFSSLSQLFSILHRNLEMSNLEEKYSLSDVIWNRYHQCRFRRVLILKDDMLLSVLSFKRSCHCRYLFQITWSRLYFVVLRSNMDQIKFLASLMWLNFTWSLFFCSHKPFVLNLSSVPRVTCDFCI